MRQKSLPVPVGNGATATFSMTDRAADALVEGAVSAAGVGADVLAGRCLGLYLFGRVQRRACDVYLILPLARGKGLFDLGANLALYYPCRRQWG